MRAMFHEAWELEGFQTAKVTFKVLAMVPFNRPHTISYQCAIANMSLSCTVSDILSLIFQNLKRSRDSEHIPFEGNISCMH